MGLNTIQQCVENHLPPNSRPSAKGWRTFDAVCCTHNGETIDKRGRGGIISSPDGKITYNCFNCNYVTGYTPGHVLGYKFRKLLSWLGVEDLEIYRLSIDALREKERQEMLGLIQVEEKKEEIKTNFKSYPLPDESLSFLGIVEFYELKGSFKYPDELIKSVEYVSNRKIDMRKYEFYISPIITHKMNKRVIIPFTWKGETIGYTARAINDSILPKFQSNVDNGYVFNMDNQERDSQFVIVCEGVFDAMSVDGVAVMRSDVSKIQIDLIESLDREIIVVPDNNKSGQHLIDVALENGWSVAFPVWFETCDDINQALVKYGKLFVLKTILDSVERSRLKIELLRRKIK